VVKKYKSQEKTFPGYVLGQMSLSDDSWITVRTTQGVTGFIVSKTNSSFSQTEVDKILNHTEEEKPNTKLHLLLVMSSKLPVSIR
jgi:transcription antitermination factor NusG